jgi:hypothetical protein
MKRIFLQLVACFVFLAAVAGAQNRSTFVSLEHSPTSLAYDPVRKLVYAAQPFVNEVDVIDVPSGRVVDRIRIPLASEVALSPASDVLFVGTRSDFIYAIDTVSRRVTKRGVVPPAVFGPTGINRMAATKSGKVLFGGGVLMQWDSNTGLFKQYNNAYLIFPEDYFGRVTISRSGDGSKVLVSTGYSQTYVYDSDSDTIQIFGSLYGPTFYNVAVNHDGSQFAAHESDQLHFYDASFNEIHKITMNPAGFVYSRDGRYLYVATYNSYGRVILTIDTASFQVVGQAPGVVLLATRYNDVGGNFYETQLFDSLPMAAGDDGLIFGPSSLGFAIEDTGHVPGLNSPAPYFGRVFPAQGPMSGGTAVTIKGLSFAAPPTSIQFGPAASTGANVQSSGIMTTTSPSSAQSGPVNLKANFASGWFAVSPHGFTYGPHILYLLTSGGPATGGTTVKIIGYGFDFNPALIQVTFGGQSAAVVSVSRDAPNALKHNGFSIQFGQYPYHLLEVITPSGAPGEADVTISTPAGATTAPRAFAYLKTSTVVPYGGELATPTYDWLRGRVYFSDPPAAKVVALDIATRQFLPITFSAGAVAGRSSLTPDGSKLVVANEGERSISVFNPDLPQSSAKVEVIQNGQNSNFFIYGLATTALNKAFVVPLDKSYSASCRMPVMQVDLSTLQVTQNSFPACLYDPPHLSSSRDGTKVFMVGRSNSGGPVRVWHAGTDSFSERQLPSSFQGFRSDVAASADGNMIVGDLDVIDSELKLRNRLYRPSSFFYVDPFTFERGMRLNASGSLAYVPREHGYVDQHNARTGELLRRIKMPAEFYVSPALGAHDDPPVMTVDDSGRTIYGVSQAGAMVVELADVPLALGSISPPVDEPVGGRVSTIRGSGFRPDTVASFGGEDLDTVFVDENTLQVTTLAHPPGQVSVSVRNPNGDSATMHAEFRYADASGIPSITSVSPNEINTRGATFVIQGQNFVLDSQVFWNGVPLPTEYKGPAELTAYHTNLVAIPLGTSQLTVKNPPPGGGVSAPAAVEVMNPAPSVGVEYPLQAIAGGPSFYLRFRGYDFMPGTKVYWNDVEVPFGGNFTYEALIDASLIAQPGTAIIRAVNPPPVLGTGTSATFTVVPASPAAWLGLSDFFPFYNTLIFGSKSGTLMVHSSGSAVFNLSGAIVSGPFAITGTTCGDSLPPGQHCAYTVEFRPVSLGEHVGTFAVTGNASVLPMQLIGTGIDVALALQRPKRPSRHLATSGAAKEVVFPFSLTSNSAESATVKVTCTAPRLRGSCETNAPSYEIGGRSTSREVMVRWAPAPKRASRLRAAPVDFSPVSLTLVLSGKWGNRSIQVNVDPALYVVSR